MKPRCAGEDAYIIIGAPNRSDWINRRAEKKFKQAFFYSHSIQVFASMIYYIIGTNCTSACFTVAIRGGRDVKEGKHDDAYSDMVYSYIFVKPYDAN